MLCSHSSCPSQGQNDKLHPHENSDPVRGLVHLVCAVLAACHPGVDSLSLRVAAFTATPSRWNNDRRRVHFHQNLAVSSRPIAGLEEVRLSC
jgi:hypothetical protein